MRRSILVCAILCGSCVEPVPVTPAEPATVEAACAHECAIGCAVGCDPNCVTATTRAIADRVLYVDLECVLAAPNVPAVERCAGVRCEA